MLRTPRFLLVLTRHTLLALAILAIPSLALAQNRPPVANAGADQNVYTGQTITLLGSASDPDGDAISVWTWETDQAPVGATWTLAPTNVQFPDFTAQTPGDYVILLLVADSHGLGSAPDYVTLHVADNLPPVAIAAADVTTITAGGTVCFDGSSSHDPEGSSLTYAWDFGDGSTVLVGPVTICHVYADIGTFNARLYVTDQRGAFGRTEITITVLPPPVEIGFDLTANTLNLRSMTRWVTGILEPAPPATPADIDVASILLNESVPVDPSVPTSIGDVDHDGLPDLTVKFNRAAVMLTLTEGDAVPVTVKGTIGSSRFEGTDVVRVKLGHVRAPSAGSVLQAGSAAEVRWDTPADVQAQWVALLWSNDDGASWMLVARDLPNTGSYDWPVPNVPTDQAKVAVVLVETADETGYLVDGVVGVSETFSIDAVVGVGGGPVTFALSVPSPSVAQVRVTFALPGDAPATLELLDVTGRRLVSREVGSLGSGRHTMNLSEGRDLSAGLYLVRLTQGPMRTTRRVVLVR